MFSRSLISAFLFAAAYSDAATDASRSGRNKGELASRGLAAPAPRHAQLGVRAADSGEWKSKFAMWGKLPWAFRQCQSTFEAHVGWKVATGAVDQLYTKVHEVTNAFDSYTYDATTEEGVIDDFRKSITQIFLSWNALLITGRDFFGRSWIRTFRDSFSRFTELVHPARTLCHYLRINLRGLLVSNNINPVLFSDVGVDLSSITGGSDSK